MSVSQAHVGDRVKPENLDQWFPAKYQQSYASLLAGRVGLNRLRAEYFVRLWAYLLLKQQQASGQKITTPLTQLHLPQGAVPCTHREAAELFYSDKPQGTDRSAGMMLDKLAALGLIEKQFDGNNVCIEIRSLPLDPVLPKSEPPQLKADAFDPRRDAVPVAHLLANTYGWLVKDIPAVQQKTIHSLRSWAEKYPTCMRVLRRCDNNQPVAMVSLYPIAGESEEYFFLPPAKSFYLTTNSDVDPLKMARPGDLDCTTFYERVWIVDPEYMNRDYLVMFLEDIQQTLTQMQVDFPNLCDFYVVVVHPVHLNSLASVLGFQRTSHDTQMSAYWMYQSIDRLLSFDMKQVMANFNPETNPTYS